MQPVSLRVPHPVLSEAPKAFPRPPPEFQLSAICLQTSSTDLPTTSNYLKEPCQLLQEAGESDERTAERKWEVEFSDWDDAEKTAIVCCSDHDHSQCELEIEELRARLSAYRSSLIPPETNFKLKSQIKAWKEMELLQKRGLEHVMTLAQHLQEQINDIQRIKSLFLTSFETIRELEVRLRNDIDAQKLSIIPANPMQLGHSYCEDSDAFLSPRPVILSKLSPGRPLSPPPHSDTSLQSLNLRIQHALGLLSTDDVDPEPIEAEVREIEQGMRSVQGEKRGLMRLKSYIASAKHRLIRLKSLRAVSDADRLISNLQVSMKATEKTLLRTQKGSVEIATKEVGRVSDDSGDSTDRGRWSSLTSAISSQEAVIADLRAKLEASQARVQEMERREDELKRRECFQGVIYNLLQGKKGKDHRHKTSSSYALDDIMASERSTKTLPCLRREIDPRDWLMLAYFPRKTRNRAAARSSLSPLKSLPLLSKRPIHPRVLTKRSVYVPDRVSPTKFSTSSLPYDQ